MNIFGVATGPTGWAYLTVLALHLVCVVVGFGGVTLNGIWGARLSKTQGEAAGVLAETLAQVSKLAEMFILGVPVFGIAAIALSDGAHSFSSPWVSLSLVLYFLGLGLSFLVMQPANRQLGMLAMAGNAPSDERAELERKVAMVAGALHLILAAVIILMVVGPNSSLLVAN